MKPYKLRLELLSPTLIGSGETFGALIDTDVVFDEVGLPFVPSKRIKGCLRDSAMEAKEIFKSSGIDRSWIDIDKTFGKIGCSESAPVYFSNLFIEDYENTRALFEYYLKEKKYPDILSREYILETFAETRQHTAIDSETGVARDSSLRTVRVIKKGITFYGDIHIEKQNETISDTLCLACLNFRFMGTKRNRGFGEIRCSLFEGDKELSIRNKLEEKCSA